MNPTKLEAEADLADTVADLIDIQVLLDSCRNLLSRSDSGDKGILKRHILIYESWLTTCYTIRDKIKSHLASLNETSSNL